MLLIVAYSEREHRPGGMQIGPVLSLDDIIDSNAAALGSGGGSPGLRGRR
jgi:hypothetical protein